jgi:preprotein translocase SecE subunit
VHAVRAAFREDAAAARERRLARGQERVADDRTQRTTTRTGKEDDAMAYKKDQGRYARLASFWVLAVLVFYGSTSLHSTLSTVFDGALASPIGGFTIPVFAIKLSPAFLIAAVVFGAGIWFLYRWLETPKVADLLIETETELKKVTWPTTPEVVNSSIVVVVCVLFLMAYLAGTDWVLARITRRWLVGD